MSPLDRRVVVKVKLHRAKSAEPVLSIQPPADNVVKVIRRKRKKRYVSRTRRA